MFSFVLPKHKDKNNMVCSFSKEFSAAANVSVENGFILEYMPEATGEAVKVYLYGLYLTEEKKGEDIACALDMTENKIREALIYWQKQGLLSYNGASWSFSKSVENFIPVVTVPDEKQTKE